MTLAPKALKFLQQRYPAFLFWFLIGVGFVASFICNEPGWQVVCLVFLLFPLVICLHELGHAVIAVCLGGKVHYIRLGRQRSSPPLSFRLLGFKWHVFESPICGAVQSSLFSVGFYRFRRCLIILAGPAVNIILAVPILFLDFDHWNRFTPFLATWSSVNAFFGVTSLIPIEMYPRKGRLRKDGLLFLDTLRYSRQTIEQYIQIAVFQRDSALKNPELKDVPVAELRKRLQEHPENAVLLVAVTLKMQLEDDPDCLEYLLRVSRLPGVPAGIVANLIDTWITNQLASKEPKNFPAMDELSFKLVQIQDSLTTRGTRGSVLIDIGRVKEGKSLLETVLAKTTSTIDQVYANIFLALAEKHEGNLELAGEHARKAAKIDPICPALPRVSDLISL